MADEHKNNRPLVGVSILVKKGDRILLVKRQNVHASGTWGAPGGHLEYGESFEHRAVEEVKEETGIEISEVKFRVVTNDVFEAEQKHYVTIWMEAKYVSGEPGVKAPYEESEVGWFTWDGLPEPLFLPLAHLLTDETYPSQTTDDKIGNSIEMPHQLKY
jgi:8-oxo-dGTP diphosphatase